jgi:dihydroorotate dehydrogenase
MLSAERAHRWVMRGLHWLSAFPALCGGMRRRAFSPAPELAVEIAGLKFEHPIALAAGLDKDAEAVGGLFALGFSAVEVGTITPRAQPGNPLPRLFRLPEARALINRMGFNNLGSAHAVESLKACRFRPGPVGINIGKNKDTPLENALQDYQTSVRELGKLGDYVVVNASSPNTPRLRQLLEPEHLGALLRGVRKALDEVSPGKPLFIKVSPDMATEDLPALVESAVDSGFQGLIATNTTLERNVQHPLASEAGGLSGEPLRARSTEVLRQLSALARGRLALIASGGVFTAQDAFEKLQAGASLVQVYTGFVYGGPAWIGELVMGLQALLREQAR